LLKDSGSFIKHLSTRENEQPNMSQIYWAYRNFAALISPFPDNISVKIATGEKPEKQSSIVQPD